MLKLGGRNKADMQRIIYFGCFLFALISFCCHGEERPAVSDYRLGSGDLIKIYVLNEENLSMEVRLSDAGTISYPFLGEIHALGRTVSELAAEITRGLKGPYLVDPKVSVSVIEYRKFFIGGEVKAPGGYPFQPGLTIQKAVALAGGFTERASSDIVVIHEDDPMQTPVEANVMTPVRPGDVITIKESFF
ncbi:polysaccharide biosynthesis/export family protein [Methylococcus sp. Mc7]|uniref:polysaccharide biosynthesis/export family protein n=2 Tax=unclassified Methylococcus TaxID=2618889 RepID=UPI00210848E6|nr:polysaccharide biosynthesis/export family protein [Methylococcus sp. Mc7]